MMWFIIIVSYVPDLRLVKSFAFHNLDDGLYTALERGAHTEGLSLNRLIKKATS